MLAYSQGAQGIGSLSMPTIGNSMGQGVGSAMQAYQTMAQVDNVKADTSNKQAQAALIQAQTDKTNAEIDTAKASAGSMIQQTAESQARIPEISAHIDLMQRQGSLTTNQAVVAKANFDNIQAMTSKLGLENAILEASKLPEASARGDFWSSDFGKKFPYIEPFLPAANSAGAAALKQWVK
jgi:Sec-independent protein translocase protein TatA